MKNIETRNLRQYLEEVRKECLCDGPGEDSNALMGACLNIGRTHYEFCWMHKTVSLYGSNLFSGWKDESQEDWVENASALVQCKPADKITADSLASDMHYLLSNRISPTKRQIEIEAEREKNRPKYKAVELATDTWIECQMERDQLAPMTQGEIAALLVDANNQTAFEREDENVEMFRDRPVIPGLCEHHAIQHEWELLRAAGVSEDKLIPF